MGECWLEIESSEGETRWTLGPGLTRLGGPGTDLVVAGAPEGVAPPRVVATAAVVLVAMVLRLCWTVVTAGPPPTRPDTYDTSALFSGQVDEGGAILGVNSFLWRASLDTLSFLPLSSADPFGGVIITDWYAPPESPNERFKVTAYILDRS